MAAFHPRTFELLREALGAETVTHTLDAARLAKLPEGSQSLMAQQLREREAAFPAVSGDLEWLLEFMQRLTDQADRHAADRATPEPDTRAASDSVLSHTPLAVAFGAEPDAETKEALAVGDVLDEHDSEPPVGTVVMLHDGSDEKWKRLDEPGEWHWAAEHQGYRTGVWRWRRVTFDGPVTVIEVPGESEASR